MLQFMHVFFATGESLWFHAFLSISATAGSGLKRVSESCRRGRLVLGSLWSCQALFTGSELLSVVVRLIPTVKPVIEAEEPRVFRSSPSGTPMEFCANVSRCLSSEVFLEFVLCGRSNEDRL